LLLAKDYSGGQIREDEMGIAYVMYGGEESAYTFLMGKPGGKKPLGRHSVNVQR